MHACLKLSCETDQSTDWHGYILCACKPRIIFKTVSCLKKITRTTASNLDSLSYIMFNQHENVQHIHLKVPLFERGGISEDLKSILNTVRYRTSQFFAHLPWTSSNLVYRSFESFLIMHIIRAAPGFIHNYNFWRIF